MKRCDPAAAIAAIILAVVFSSAAGNPADSAPTVPVDMMARPPAGFRLLHLGKGIRFFGQKIPGEGTVGASYRRDIVDRRSLEGLSQAAEATIDRISTELGVPPGPAIEVFLVQAGTAIPESVAVPSLPGWAAGAAFGAEGKIVLLAGRKGVYPDQDLAGVLTHECAHVILDRALARSGQRVPRWFAEGFAVLESRPWGWTDALHLATTVVPSSPPRLLTLEGGFPAGEAGARSAYAISVSFLSSIERRAGPEAPARIVRAMMSGLSFRAAFREATGAEVWDLEAEWRRSVSFLYRWVPLITSSGAVWTVVLVLLFLAAARRRARRRALEEAWEHAGFEDGTRGGPVGAEDGDGGGGNGDPRGPGGDPWVN